MLVYNTVSEIQKHLASKKAQGKTIGFVPSMGALHPGHLSLVEEAAKQCDIVVVSIFVNPTQFNNISDLQNYPRTLDADIAQLSNTSCSVIFSPSVEEIYPNNYQEIDLDLGSLKGVMEDGLRPGHFKGVINVVSRLFDIVKPDKAFFGLKDFQQVAVINYMVKMLEIPVIIIACPTVRETSGLAMSSRNLRLTEQQKEEALVIYKSLNEAKNLSKSFSPEEVKKKIDVFFNAGSLVKEYIEIVDPSSLKSLTNEWVSGATMCIAAFCGEVRLIDNMQLV